MNTGRRAFLKTSLIVPGMALWGNTGSLLAGDNDAPSCSKTGITEPFTFGVIADPHCGEPGGIDKFFACIDAMEKLEGDEKPDFVLVLGDIHLWVLKDHLSRIPIPLHVISGNHEGPERKKQMREMFPSDFSINGKPSDYYSFVHKGMRFIGVCNARAKDHIGTFCSEDFGPRGQCEWLEQELDEKESHKIVFGHIPPEPDGKDRNMYISRNDSRWFNAVVADTGPTAMFFGHQHRQTVRQTIGMTPCYTVRSCCWNSGGASVGFIVVRVTAAGIQTREILTNKGTQEINSG